MTRTLINGTKEPSRPTPGALALALAGAVWLTAPSAPAWADNDHATAGNHWWGDDSAAAAEAMPQLSFAASHIPATIPVYQSFSNGYGASATYQPSGPTTTATNAFFQSLGSNGRTCASCHAPAAAWSVTPTQVQTLFYSTGGTDPLFQPVDGANCANADVSTFQARLSASSLLLSKGLIRVFEAVSGTAQYTVNAISDPYNCNTNPATGLTAYGPNTAPAGFLSVYRRPLPAANLNVLSTILADGRETTLQQQAIDANRIHAQTLTPLTAAQVAQMVTFETGLYAAQTQTYLVGSLTANGAGGGPVAFAQTPFYLGINDPFGLNPTGAAFTPDAFTLYNAWATSASSYQGGDGQTGQSRALIARGQKIFNETPFTISGVTGLNDVLGVPSFTGTCTSCHDTPNAGTHSVNQMMDTGTSAPNPPGLDNSTLPVFTLQCAPGAAAPLSVNAGGVVVTTDPGRATLSGQCADIGRVKVLTLRNLAARPPYFHNGAAATLDNVVQFYNARFNIGLGLADRVALAAFLASL